jgi:predicted patatin/cPLA2 family phospholipase
MVLRPVASLGDLAGAQAPASLTRRGRARARGPSQPPRVACAASRDLVRPPKRDQSPARGAGPAAAAAAAEPAAAARTLPPPAPAPPRPGLARRLRAYLPAAAWAVAAAPLAAQLGAAVSASDVEEGMAAAAPLRAAAALLRRRAALRGAPPPPEPPEPPVDASHAALALLRARVAAGSRPGARADGFRLGLVVEGGGMRGSVSAGALQALADLGVRGAFDAVYGSSAGAVNATYFLSDQRDGVDVYSEHIARPEFIDLARLVRRRAAAAGWIRPPRAAAGASDGEGSGSDGEAAAPAAPAGAASPADPPAALNLDYLLEEVMTRVHPLDWGAVVASPVPLKVVASCLDSLRPVLLEGFTSPADLAACLRASACVPEVAGGYVAHRGLRLVDAAVFEAVPFRSAIADGCTHVLVLATRPPPARRSRLGAALGDAVAAAVKRAVLSPAYMQGAWRAEVAALVADGLSQDEMLARARDPGAHELPWFAGAHVFAIYPAARPAAFSPLCIDRPTLLRGVAEGRRATLAVMREALGGVLDFEALGLAGEAAAPPGGAGAGAGAPAASNIVPAPRGERRERADFSTHG